MTVIRYVPKRGSWAEQDWLVWSAALKGTDSNKIDYALHNVRYSPQQGMQTVASACHDS